MDRNGYMVVNRYICSILVYMAQICYIAFVYTRYSMYHGPRIIRVMLQHGACRIVGVYFTHLTENATKAPTLEVTF